MANRSDSANIPGDVLLATDLSSRCDRALDRALQLTKEWRAKLHVVHALPDETDYRITGTTWSAHSRELDELREDADRQLRRDLGSVTGGEQIQVHIKYGVPGEVICDLTAREHCTLIVTGVARNETLGRMLLGDTVDFLVRKADVPVLVVRNRVHGPYGDVLAATDFSPASREAIHASLAMFPQAAMTLVHAYEIPFSSILLVNHSIRAEFRDMGDKATREFLQAADLPEDFPYLLEVGSPAAVIAKLLEAQDALVVIGSHGASALTTILLGSTARRILNHTSADVLVVPFTKRHLASA